jgi:hypothetical protein
MTACGKAAAFGRAGAAGAGALGLHVHGGDECCRTGEQGQAESGFHLRFSFCGFGSSPFWCRCLGVGLPRVPVSGQPSSVPAPMLLDALALLVELPDVVDDMLELAWSGVTVTVEPSGIVVMPLNPFGPELTLLDIPLDGGMSRLE